MVKEFDLNCIYDSVGRDELKRFFYNFYTEGFAGMLINLFQHPDKYTKTDLLKYLSVIINNSIPAAILNKTVV